MAGLRICSQKLTYRTRYSLVQGLGWSDSAIVAPKMCVLDRFSAFADFFAAFVVFAAFLCGPCGLCGLSLRPLRPFRITSLKDHKGRKDHKERPTKTSQMQTLGAAIAESLAVLYFLDLVPGSAIMAMLSLVGVLQSCRIFAFLIPFYFSVQRLHLSCIPIIHHDNQNLTRTTQ